jgi:hypothetical protein
MKKNVEIVVLLDKSGSMDSIWDSTIEGFNKFLVDQKEKTENAKMSLIQFDHRYEVSYESVNIQHVALLNHETYVPTGLTALLDSMGKSIRSLQQRLINQEKDTSVIFVVITDGFENASREYTSSSIKQMVKEMETKNEWQFVYLGANQDAISEGARFGFTSKKSMTFANNEEGVSNAFMSLSNNIYQCINEEVYMSFSKEDREMQEAAMNNTKERGHQEVQDSSMNNKKEWKGMRELKIRKKLTNRLSEIDGMDIIDGCKIC